MEHDVPATLALASNGAAAAVVSPNHTNVMAPGRDGPVNLLKEPCFAINFALTRVNRARVNKSRAEESLERLRSNGNDPLKRQELQQEIHNQGEELHEASKDFLELKRRLIELKPRMPQHVRWKLRDSGRPLMEGYDRPGMPAEVRAATLQLCGEFR